MYKLLVLVVGDFCLVHPEGLYCCHIHVVLLFKDCGLGVGTHHERTFANKHHSVRICFLKLRTIGNAYQLAGRFVTCC